MRKIYYGWWVVAGGFILLFCAGGTFFYGFPVFYEAILRDTGWTRTETAAALSIAMLLFGSVSPFTGAFIHKVGVKAVMVTGGVLSGIALVLMSTIAAPWQFYLYYGIIFPLGMSGIQVVPVFTTVERWFTKRRSTALAVTTIGIGAGAAILAPLASVLISVFDWRKTFLLFASFVALAGVLVGIFIMRFPRDNESEEPGQTGTPVASEPSALDGVSFRDALKTRAFWFLSLVALLWSWAEASGVIHQVAFAVDMGIDRVAAAGTVSLVTASSIIGRIVFGRLGDRIDKRYVFMIATTFQASAFIVLTRTSNLTMLYLYSVLLGIGIGGMLPIVAGLIAEHFGRKSFSIIYGALFFWQNVGNVIGPLYAGWIFDTTGNYITAFTTSIVLSFAAIIFAYLSGKSKAAGIKP